MVAPARKPPARKRLAAPAGAGAARSSRVPAARDPKARRAAILAAATAEFADKGLGGARVDEIARRAGVNKALLYHHFGAKDALFLAVLEHAYAGIREAEAGVDLERLPPVQAMERLVDFTFDYFVAHPEFLTLLNSENLHRGRHLRRSRRLRELHAPLVGRLKGLLARGEAAGVFRSGVDPVALYVSIASLGYFYLSNAWTLGAVFAKDLTTPRARRARRSHAREVILGYLRPDGS
jgi:AcrR family transcriptional regulator